MPANVLLGEASKTILLQNHNRERQEKMNNTTIPIMATPPIIREYEVGGIKYIVSATVKAGAKETATSKVRRLIRNEIKNIF